MAPKSQIAQLQMMHKRAAGAIDTIPGLEKVTADRVVFYNDQESIIFNDATLYFDRNTNSYIAVGGIQIENMNTVLSRVLQQVSQNAAMAGAMSGKTHSDEAEQEIDASEEGVNMEDVKLLMEQTQKTKEEVIVALKKASGDMIEAMDLLQ